MTLKQFRELTKDMPEDREIMYHSYNEGCSITPYDIEGVWIKEDDNALVMNPGEDYDDRTPEKFEKEKAKWDKIREQDEDTKVTLGLLFSQLNMMGNGKEIEQALEEVLRSEHRTLQQGFFRHVIVPSIRIFAKKMDEKAFDLRNEASCETAKKMMPIVEKALLPFI